MQVDAHVGKHLFHEAICGALKDKTRILVTHALHFLPQVDYVICLDHGKITQQGTYAELMADDTGPFAEIFREFGGGMEEEKEEEAEKEEDAVEEAGKKPEKLKAKALMQEEERATGSVGGAGELFVLLFTAQALTCSSPSSLLLFGVDGPPSSPCSFASSSSLSLVLSQST